MSRAPNGTPVLSVTYTRAGAQPAHPGAPSPLPRHNSGSSRGSCVALEMHRLPGEPQTAADFRGKGYREAFYSNIFLALEDITFQENYEISHAEPGSAQTLSN